MEHWGKHIGWYVSGELENSFCLIHRPEGIKENCIEKLWEYDIATLYSINCYKCYKCGIRMDKQYYLILKKPYRNGNRTIIPYKFIKVI